MTRPHRDSQTGFEATFRPLLDDRRRPIQRLDRRDLVRAARSESPGLRALADRLKCAVKSESMRNTPDRVILSVGLIVAVLFVNGFMQVVVIPMLGIQAAGVGLLVFVLLILVAQRMLSAYIRRGAMAQLARTAVAEGICGSCAFSLEGAPVGENGHTLCPECGAAWRTERIVSPFWVSPTPRVLRTSLRAGITPGVRSIHHLYAPDDRGRYVQTPDSRLIRPLPELLDTVPAEERRAIRRSMRQVGRWWRAGITLFLLLFPGLLYMTSYNLWMEDERGPFWFALGLAVFVTIPILFVPFSAAVCSPHRTCRVITRSGRCGTCLRSLRDAPTDHAGRAVCPCGSAWLR